MPPKSKVVKPDSYKGFVNATINLGGFSGAIVKFERFQLPKVFTAEFALVDWGSMKKNPKGEPTYLHWFVIPTFELTDYGTPELLRLVLKGSASQNYHEHFKTGFYEGITPDARPIAKWQTDFINQNLNQFTLRAMVEAVSFLEKGDGDTWRYHRRESLISDSSQKEFTHAMDHRLRQSLTPEFITEVAFIYSQAKLAGTHPTRYVMQHYKVARITASRWVRQAVDLKLLPEPESQGKSSNANKKLVQSITAKEGKK